MEYSDKYLRDSRGNRYATAELAQQATARIAREDAKRDAKAEAEAEEWEAGLKAKFMDTPGATEADWTRNRQTVIDDARKANALSDDDAARKVFRRSYA